MLINQLLRVSYQKIIRISKLYKSTWIWTEPKGKDTGIIVYNSITRTKVPLILPRNVLYWYMCGPTVYADAHIGHAFCYVKFDILRRILENFFQLNVIQVMGMTDIDDKIIKRANEVGIGYRELALKYENDFLKDMKDLNVLRPTSVKRVSDSISQIVSFIEKLEESDYAYKGTDGSMYFDVTRYNGKLKPSISESFEQHSRVDNSMKKNPADFALWKAVKPGEPYWESPWGKGRPGWHIECSSIASNIFGENMDIHSGGIDLIFPHHENELAQSEAYHSVDQWVNYWLHSGHLQYKSEKMSKSLNNVISIQEFLSEYSANEFRVFCLLSHYRHEVDFGENTLKAASGTLKKFEDFFCTVDSYIHGNIYGGDINEEEIFQKLENCKMLVNDSLADDFNTREAIMSVLSLVSYTNTIIQSPQSKSTGIRKPGAIAAISNYVDKVLNGFGIIRNKIEGDSKLTELKDIIETVLKFRNEVRQTMIKGDENTLKSDKKKLLNACDQLRNSLTESGIEIRDHGMESSWSFNSKK